MKRTINSSVPLLFFLVILFVIFSMISVEARKLHIRKTKPHKHLKDKSGNSGHSNFPGPAPPPLPHYGSVPTQSSIFDVFSFGAKGDGVSDDSKVI